MNVIYVDVLFGVNMFVHYFLLLATSKICKKRVKFFRMLLGSFVATIFTAVIFLPEVNFILNFFIRFFISGIVTFSTFGFEKIPKFLSRLFCFYSVSFGYAGIILSLWILLKPKGVFINNGAVYIDISPYVLLLSFLLGYFILLLLRKHFGTDIEAGNVLKMTVFFEEKSAEFFVLYDTGNKLHDMFSDLPVAVVNIDATRELFPKELEVCLTNNVEKTLPKDIKHKEKFKIIPYSVVGGTGVLPAIKVDRILIEKNHKILCEKQGIIAVSNEIFEDGIDGIIGEDFIKC